MDLSEELFRPAQNRVELVFSKQSKPSDRGKSKDHRSLAGAFASLTVEDSRGKIVASFDPVYQRFSLGRGFHLPEAELVEAQSAHFKTRPVWSLLGDLGHRIGVVGYWSTWPAYEVNGFLVSSRMGMRGRRQGTREHLTWPAELAGALQPLKPTEAEMKEVVTDLYAPSCSPANPRASRSSSKSCGKTSSISESRGSSYPLSTKDFSPFTSSPSMWEAMRFCLIVTEQSFLPIVPSR